MAAPLRGAVGFGFHDIGKHFGLRSGDCSNPIATQTITLLDDYLR